jgi:hypothetical protein
MLLYVDPVATRPILYCVPTEAVAAYMESAVVETYGTVVGIEYEQVKLFQPSVREFAVLSSLARNELTEEGTHELNVVFQ